MSAAGFHSVLTELANLKLTEQALMDSIFLLGEPDCAAFLRHMMQFFGCTYICLWSYSPLPYKWDMYMYILSVCIFFRHTHRYSLWEHLCIGLAYDKTLQPQIMSTAVWNFRMDSTKKKAASNLAHHLEALPWGFSMNTVDQKTMLITGTDRDGINHGATIFPLYIFLFKFKFMKFMNILFSLSGVYLALLSRTISLSWRWL